MKICVLACFALLAQLSFAQQNVPEIPYDSVPDFPKLPPGMNFGEVPGVAVNSKGHIFVFTRSNSATGDRKSTRLNSSHSSISYAVFCLKKKKKNTKSIT